MARQVEQLSKIEGGQLDRAGGLYLLTLRGNRQQLGERHAELTRYISADVPARYYRGLLATVIRNSLHGPTAGIRAGVVARLLYALSGFLNRKSLDCDLLEENTALSTNLKCRQKIAKQLLLFPDILHYLAGKRAASGHGCSAVFVAPALSAGDGALLGRTFDFFGPGVWDEYQALKRFFPDQGMPYLWVGPLGIPVGGFGLNKAGLAIMPLTLFNRDCGLKGTPMFAVMDRLLREADSLQTATKIIDETKMGGSFSLMVADMAAGDARTFGIGKKQRSVHEVEDGRLLRTNHEVAGPLLASERAPANWQRHSHARLQRMDEYVSTTKKITAEGLMALLADGFDPVEGREALVGGTLPAVNNAQSVVLDWARGILSVGCGYFPVARSGEYEQFSLKNIFSDKPAWKGTSKTATGIPSEELEAVHLYSAAWQACFDRGDRRRALRMLRDGGALAAKEPAFPRISGLLLLKSGDWEWAVRDLRRAFALEPDGGGRRIETGLWLARALDCAGSRAEAVELYDKISEMDPEGTTGKRALAGLKKPYRRGKAHRILVDLITASAE